MIPFLLLVVLASMDIGIRLARSKRADVELALKLRSGDLELRRSTIEDLVHPDRYAPVLLRYLAVEQDPVLRAALAERIHVSQWESGSNPSRFWLHVLACAIVPGNARETEVRLRRARGAARTSDGS